MVRSVSAAHWFGLLLLSGFTTLPGAVLTGSGAELSEVDPAITREQIEEDWLLQARTRLDAAPGGSGKVTCEEDAAGGVDGEITGKWGFHTELEDDPWWQVDLGSERDLDRLTLYNRCDGGYAERAARIQVLLSSDGSQFIVAYTHDGSVFLGQPDNKPLVVSLAGQRARYVRLRVPGRTYFHLDEVHVQAPGDTRNIALHQPATQSSVSQWSVRHSRREGLVDWKRVIATTVQRGQQLASALRGMGVDTNAWTDQLAAVERQLEAWDDGNSERDGQASYFRTRAIVRAMALSNPLIDFDRIVFIKRAPSMFPHMSDQNYGWWARPGGGIWLLDGLRTDRPTARCLTGSWPEGNFLQADLSYDGDNLLFAFSRYHAHVADVRNKRDKNNLPEDVFYHLFEMNLQTGDWRQVTRGKYDDFDGRYLPSGDIVFLSTRKGQFLQTSRPNTQKTLAADLPDSYVRCGGDDYRPVPVFTLHATDRDGRAIWPISAFETFEYTPSVANDGRVLYCRWDYIDRFNGHFFSLWSSNPDGTNPQLVYGNFTVRPQVTLEPRSIPHSNKIIFTAAAHHSITGGSLVLLDPARGNEGEAPLTRLTPEVPFPETEQNVDTFYANPWPLSEEFYLVSWSNRALPPHGRYEDEQNPVNAQGIYLVDRFGNLELLYRDVEISSMMPIPVRPRPKPKAYSSAVAWEGEQTGGFLLQDVYQGLTGIDRGTVKRLRIVGVVPKVQPHMNTPSLGVSREETGKFVLGTVPVEADGSAHFQVPSGVPVFFQALDEQGFALQTMRSLTYVQPGQTLSCIGCHEPRQHAPGGSAPLAFQREPSRLKLDVEGTWPLRFDALVQPVLDKQCAACHGPAAPPESAAAKFDLSSEKAWQTLIGYADNDLSTLVFERDASVPGFSPARESKLLKYLTTDPQHREIALTDDDLRRLITWIDTYGQTQGAFSAEQEASLTGFRDSLKELLE